MVATTPAPARVSWWSRIELGTLLPGVVFAGVMLWSVARSLIVANWASGIEILLGIALLSLLVGVMFARLEWLPGWLAHPLAGALGIAWVVEQVGPTLTQRVAEEFGSDLAMRLDTWGERASEILLRALVWLRILQAGGRGEDIVLFLVVMALVIWLLGYSTGWLLFRLGRVWLTIAINGMIILINYTFIFPKPTDLFFVFLGSALLLMVFQHLVAQQRLWRAALIEFPSTLAWRATASAGIFCIALVLGTSLIPGAVTSAEAQAAWRLIRSPFAALRESWQDAFSTINAPPGTSGSFATRGVRVGGPRSLSDAVVMRVRSARYEYWRAVAFDKYNGLNWQNTVGERARATLGVATAEQARSVIQPEASLIQAELRARELITQTITLEQTRTDGLLMVGGQFAASALPVLIQHGILSNDTGDLIPNYTEITSVVAETPLEAGMRYTISSYISTVDQHTLREAGQNYPAWVRESYLQLPDTLPPRVRERAREIISQANATNPYDQATAIQNVLRSLTYNEARSAPPNDRDWVDYFLFESQQGYCDDFATAMVVLLRAEGVPARWVQGYAGGTLDPETREWVVRESVAHSWVEVYFPGYGWQRFEPTPAPYAVAPVRPLEPRVDGDDRPESSGDISNQLSDPEEILRRMREREEELSGGGGDLSELERLIAEREAAARERVIINTLLAVGTLLLVLVGVWGMLEWPLRGLSRSAAGYARLVRLGHWAGISYNVSDTPREYAQAIGADLTHVGEGAMRIAAAYEAECYRPDHQTLGDPRVDWPRVRQALIGRMIGRIFDRSTRQNSAILGQSQTVDATGNGQRR
jgi:hypothetical protein